MSFFQALCYNRFMKRAMLLKCAFCAILAVALLLACAGCDGLYANADHTSGLRINEVVSSNARSLVDETLGTPDWIELYNASASPINLSGYGLTDNPKEPHKWTFPDVTIPAGGYLVVYATKAEGTLCTGFGLSRSGDSLCLSDKYYTLLDYIDLPALERDVSYARGADGAFGYCASPTPGAENTAQIVPAPSLLAFESGGGVLAISEVLPNNVSYPDAFGNYPAWAELWNVSDTPVLLSEYYLSDDAEDASKWRLPDAVLQPGETVLVFFSGRDETSSGEYHASFKLGSKDTALLLFCKDGTLSDSLTWPEGLPEDIAALPYGLYTAYPTPGATNDTRTFSNAELTPMDGGDAVRINEFLLHNEYSLRDADGDRPAWVELRNATDSAVSLAGYYLSDDPKDPFKWAFPAEAVIAPQGYLLVFLSGKGRTEGELHTSFRLTQNDAALLLSAKDGLRSDFYAIDPALGDNISVGIEPQTGETKYYATPTPGAANTAHGFDTLISAVLPDMGGVYISEVSAVAEAKSAGSAWIEFYNASGRPVSLSGWHITDDADELQKYALPAVTIEAGGYTVVSATKRTAKQRGDFVALGISEAGETLLLSDADGNIVDVFKTGALRAGITSGRLVGSGVPDRVFFTSATKGKPNGTAARSSYAADPVFSETALYQEAAFSLMLSTATEGAEIRYTTDGSEPGPGSTLYTGPLTISGNTVVRAATYCDGLLPSDSVAMTYLFEVPHTVPVVCISISPAAFSEVYTATTKKERVEREGVFSFYEDGALGVSFPCGFRASGASTLTAAQKSLAVLLRSGYGVSETNYPFFAGSDVSAYRSLVLRNSGQDRTNARIRDSFCMKAVKGLNIEQVETRLTVVYINGQYWGVYDLNENQNEDYLAAHYGVDPDAVDIIRRNSTALEGSKYDFLRVREYALNRDLSNDAAFAEFAQWVDVEYFTDYLIAQTYFANSDMFNQKYWRSADYSVKWRPVFFDLDFGLHSASPMRSILPLYFQVEGVPSQDGSLTNMDIYVGLRKNAAWCDYFCERYVYVVLNYFNEERLTAILDEMTEELRFEWPRHAARWSEAPSLSKWESSVAALRDCLAKRADYALKYLQKEFGVSDEKMEEYRTKALSTSA